MRVKMDIHRRRQTVGIQMWSELAVRRRYAAVAGGGGGRDANMQSLSRGLAKIFGNGDGTVGRAVVHNE